MRWLLVLGLACSGKLDRVAPPVVHDAAIDTVPHRDVDVPDVCTDTVMGKPFRGARMLCLAMSSMALVSLAIEDGRDVRARVAALADEALTLAARAPFDTPAMRIGELELPASVLYRGLLGMMGLAVERAGATTQIPVDALAASLVRDLERGWVASYRDGIWPCDHAPAAAFLQLHGVLRGNAASTGAADALVDKLRTLLARGFPTRIDRRGAIVDATVRTTALAFTASHLLAAEPVVARAFADAVAARCDRVACREWDRPRRPDAASGPLVGGYSVGATALAIVALRARADGNAALLQTVELVGRGRLGSLERALLAWGETARAW